MLEDKQTGEVTTADKHPLSELTHWFGHYAHVDEITPFSIPSPQIAPQHMLRLAAIIHEKVNEYDGFVITHGTDTLEETAYFLDLISETEKPIIITGAMRSANEIGSDALYNLISSLRTATSDDAWNKGVLVVMNDEIHTARNVTKTSTSNVATFQSPQHGPIGIVTKESIIFYHTILTRDAWPVSKITQNVSMLKAYAGMDVEILDAIRQAAPDGLVLEALGQGNLPKQTLPSLQRYIEDNIPVILVSRCYKGIVQPTYAYDGGGKQLMNMGVIFADGLTGPKARLKLLVALETTTDKEKLKEMFEKNY